MSERLAPVRLKQWLLAAGALVVTLLLALAVIRWLAPGLLGVPTDLQLVRVAKEVPPFFENIFRDHDFDTDSYIILDPYLKRAQPLYPDRGAAGGPHDLLGFRNASIPNRPDIIVIGDSQTYGNNVALVRTWPSELRAALRDPAPVVYSMAVGGWGAVEYLEIFPKALRFWPSLVVVAFYTGNDPLEAFRLAYGNQRWKTLRPDRGLSERDMPRPTFPPPPSERWPVAFPDGVSTVFTPELRLASNADHPAVEAGYAIMTRVAQRIAEIADRAGVRVRFTIIPTKELAYALKVKAAGLSAPPAYEKLVQGEEANIRTLAAAIEELRPGSYIDVAGPLQAAALSAVTLYPTNLNGHPVEAGYQVIARAVAGGVLEVRNEEARQAQLFQQAWDLQRNNRFEESVVVYDQLLALNPRHDQGSFNLAYGLIRRGDAEALARAVSLLEPMVERRPDYTEVLYRLGEAYRLQGDAGQAAKWFESFLKAGGPPDLMIRAGDYLKSVSGA